MVRATTSTLQSIQTPSPRALRTFRQVQVHGVLRLHEHTPVHLPRLELHRHHVALPLLQQLHRHAQYCVCWCMTTGSRSGQAILKRMHHNAATYASQSNHVMGSTPPLVAMVSLCLLLLPCPRAMTLHSAVRSPPIDRGRAARNPKGSRSFRCPVCPRWNSSRPCVCRRLCVCGWWSADGLLVRGKY